MNMAAVTAQPRPAGETCAGRARVRPLILDLEAVIDIDAVGVATLLEARRVLEAQTGGTLALRANSVVCRELGDTGTIAAFALWSGRGT